jgi:hypothetical protein
VRTAPMGIALLVALLGTGSLAHGQRATERFIPIGQSPGISGRLSTIGTIEAVHEASHRIELAGPEGVVRVAIADSTRIWLDRHARGLTTAAGSFADLREGVRVEVRYADPETRDVAAWVKIDAS